MKNVFNGGGHKKNKAEKNRISNELKERKIGNQRYTQRERWGQKDRRKREEEITRRTTNESKKKKILCVEL